MADAGPWTMFAPATGASPGDGDGPWKMFSTSEKSPSSPSMATGIMRSAAEGVPILGGLLNKGDAAIDAALAPVANRFFPKDQQLSEPTFGERYKHALAIQEDMDKSFEAEHPVASALSGLAGGIASTGGVASTATGAKLLGLTGKTLPALMRGGAISGATVGTLDAAARGGNPLVGGAVGAATGGLAPGVAHVVGEALSPLGRAIRGLRAPEDEAARRVASALDRDLTSGDRGLSAPEFVQAQQQGQPVTLAELGGRTTRDLARSAANTSPEARGTLERNVDDQFATQGNRLTDWLNRSFNYPDAIAQQQAIEDVGKTVNGPAYAKAYSAPGAQAIWNEDFEQISQSPTVQTAIRLAMNPAKEEAARTGFTPPRTPFKFDESGRLVLKQDANGNRMVPSLQFWDHVKRNLDKLGTPEAREWSRVLRQHLDDIVPAYADARSGAAKFFGAENALEAGQQAVTSRMQNREMAAGLAKMSPAERRLFQDGFVDRYVQTLRESPDRRSILTQIAKSPAARERIGMALGPQKAGELEAFLRAEGLMELTRSAVKGNSTTARQLMSLGLAGGVNLYEGKGRFTADPAALAHSLLAYGLGRGISKGSAAIDERVVQQVAKLLTSNDISSISKGIKMISKNKKLLGALRNVDAAFAAGGIGATPQLGKAADVTIREIAPPRGF